jgi:O-antigen ligase/tetratricopeptide (TPR) repeat protein
MSSTKASSSFSSVTVARSRAPIVVRGETNKGTAESAGFLWALLGVCILILLGGGHHTCALGFALVLPGIALLLRPPERSLGKWMDVGIVGLLGTLLFAFVPLFYWQEPTWRTTAVEAFEIDLPSILTVQPWISFEAYLSAIAGFCWLYAAGSWKVNYEGRRRIYLFLSCLIAAFAVVVILGNLYDWRYPGAESATAFSFFQNRNQTADFIAIGGVLTFGFAMEGLRGRKVTHLAGLLASVLCLGALVYGVSRAGVLLYFGGIFLWFVFSLRRSVMSLFLKVGVPVVLLIFSFFITSNERAVERAAQYISAPMDWVGSYRSLIYRDTIEMIQDAPLTGVGLGNFDAVFPQYRNLSRSDQHAVHPESDLLWLGAEGGIIAVCFLGLFIFSYLRTCAASRAGRSGAYRMIALTGVIMFLLHGIFDVSGHRPGTAYFAIIFAALALPRATSARPSFKPAVWRVVGGGLLLFGVLWIVGGLFDLPTHSKVALEIQEERADESRALMDLDRADRAVDEVIAVRPLYWRGYFQRAQIALSRGGARSEVAQDFRRARFVEPNIGMIAYEEGVVWLPYDLKRTISAWREALARSGDSRDRLHNTMLMQAYRNVALMEGMVEMSRVDPDYHARAILYLRGEALHRELEAELRADPSLGKFTTKHRAAIVRHWIGSGEFDGVEAYLEACGDTLDSPWLMYAMLRKNQSRYEEAVGMIREALTVPEIPEVTVDRSRIDRLKRGFFASSNDLAKGTALLSYYLESGEFREALRVVNELLRQSNSPGYVYYWRAEMLYQLEDYSESWYAFEAYWKQLD